MKQLWVMLLFVLLAVSPGLAQLDLGKMLKGLGGAAGTAAAASR